jgi:ApaG protein
MPFKVTAGVKVSVECFYQPDYSNPSNGEFMFAYRITIENGNPYAIKLMRRHWHIFDSNMQRREVEGEGVVGVQPVIQPSEIYQYVSGCNLRTEMGKMHGTYEMIDLDSQRTFTVNIPEFVMIAPLKLN